MSDVVADGLQRKAGIDKTLNTGVAQCVRAGPAGGCDIGRTSSQPIERGSSHPAYVPAGVMWPIAELAHNRVGSTELSAT
jgi:hypothetical protein